MNYYYPSQPHPRCFFCSGCRQLIGRPPLFICSVCRDLVENPNRPLVARVKALVKFQRAIREYPGFPPPPRPTRGLYGRRR